MRLGRQAQRLILAVLLLLLITDLGVIVWVLATGGGLVRLGSLELSVTHLRNPLTVLVLLGSASILLACAGPGGIGSRWPARWMRAARDRWLRTRRTPLRLAGQGLVVVTLLFAARSWSRLPDLFGDLRQEAAAREVTGMFPNQGYGHLPPLLAAVVSREDPSAVAVRIQSAVDPRGYVAAYYCYPRLLMMEPELRRWTLRAQMRELDLDDPGFEVPGEQPGLDRSLAFSASHGIDLLLASEDGASWLRTR